MKLGYNRAGRIIDQLEAAGIVGPFEGSKARQVLIADLESLEQYLKEIGIYEFVRSGRVAIVKPMEKLNSYLN